MELHRLLLPTNLPESTRQKVRAWVWLAVGALAIAGIFSIIIAAARAPGTQALFPNPDFFRLALTVHVNLSVLVWLLAMAMVLLSLGTAQPNSPSKLCAALHHLSLSLAAAGCAGMALAPFFTQDALPYLNNYVPMISGDWFWPGLLLFLGGIALTTITRTIGFARTPKPAAPLSPQYRLHYNATSAICITLLSAFICGYISLWLLNRGDARISLNEGDYYEHLFWPMGHLLQFTYTQCMLMGWLVLAGAAGVKIPTRDTAFINAAFLLNILATLVMPFVLATLDPLGAEYMLYFTAHMQWLGGIAPLLVAGILLRQWWPQRIRMKPHAGTRYLLWSLLLFGVGGLWAAHITEINTVVPAHYHGSIVGVTLALMGYAVLLLPSLGYADASQWRITRWQPVLYGGGQLLHIIGLGWSGGYGALRKTPGAMESMEGKIAMGVMGLGGLIAVIGGVLFIIIMVRAFLQKR